MKKRYELVVHFDLECDCDDRFQVVPILIKFFGRIKARAIIKRGLKYKDGTAVVYVSPHRISSVRLQSR